MREVFDRFRTLSRHPITGLKAAHRRKILLPRILDWVFPYYALEPHPVSLHVATGRDDWLDAAWTCASFFHASRQNWNLSLHAGARLPDDAAEWFADAFPNARVIGREEADTEMEHHLRHHPRCRSLRAAEPSAAALFDAARFATGRKFLLLRVPTLFFLPPEDLVACASDPADACWFSRGETELPDALLEACEERAGVRPWPRLEGAVSLLSLSAFSLDLCEATLESPAIAESDPADLFSALAGLCAAKAGRGGILGPEYASGKGALPQDRIVCRHYRGPEDAVLFADDVGQLAPKILPENEG